MLYVKSLAEFFLDDVFYVAFINDGAVVVNNSFVEKQLRAVAVDVSHKEVVGYGVTRAVGDSLGHPLGSAVGEGKAQHIAVLHASLVCMHHTLG